MRYARDRVLGEEAMKKGLCFVCKKNAIYFSKSIRMCLSCLERKRRLSKVYRERHKEEVYLQIQQWRKNNPEKVKEYSKNNRINNPETRKRLNRKYKSSPIGKAKARQYYEKNKSRITEVNALWKSKNVERMKSYIKEYRREHSAALTLYVNNRRSKIKSLGTINIEEWELLFNKFENKCLWCGKSDIKLTIDHVIPITKGGLNLISNIQPLCSRCNSKKNNKTIDFRPFGAMIMEWT
jgi:5-methylcytosine-specific restriction endonuclease McrA